MQTYYFCSISHQQGLVILNYLKDVFDEQDVNTLKNLVRKTFQGDTKFYYTSGFSASGMTMGQITKIAFELRHLT